MGKTWWLALALFLGCNDDLIVPGVVGPEAPSVDAQGYCAVQELFASECLVCHSAASALGALDLETDAHGALVGVESTTAPGRTLVVAGDPTASLLLRKLDGSLANDEGGVMPPGGDVGAAWVEAVQTWIGDGAPGTCDEEPPEPGGDYHPEGFAVPDVHGTEAKLQTQACTTCHGADLTGDAGPSCDTCHQAGWRTTCTFCHGGTLDQTGAPPRDISGEDGPARISFPPHHTHVTVSARKDALPCTSCHEEPTDVLSPGHLFVGDATPGAAEVGFRFGLSDAGTWNNGTCSNLYCHGNGRGDNGTVRPSDAVATCHDCHPDASSGRDGWERMSGEHEEHLRDGRRCADCHSATVSNNTTISDVTKHVDGTAQFVPTSGVTYNGTTCTGTCHNEIHNGRRWR